MAHKTAAEIEAYAKEAARAFCAGEYSTLNQALVATIKTAGLNREQVQRAVEMMNKEAYQKDFFSKTSSERNVEFSGGPARIAEVMAQLNSVPERIEARGLSDYDSPPKQAEAGWEQFDRDFALRNPEEPPIRDRLRECTKLAQQLRSRLQEADSHKSACETALEYNRYAMLRAVKEAHAEGLTLGDVVYAWSSLQPPEVLVKKAMGFVGPAVFKMVRSNGESNDLSAHFKVAAEHYSQPINTDHPLLTTFREFCRLEVDLEATNKVAGEIERHLAQLESFTTEQRQLDQRNVSGSPLAPADGAHTSKVASLVDWLQMKEASQDPRGLFSKGRDAVLWAAGKAGQGAEALAKPLADAGSTAPARVGKLVEAVVAGAPVVGGGLMALKGVQHLHAASESPTGRYLKSFIPGTDAHAEDQLRLQMAYGANPGYY